MAKAILFDEFHMTLYSRGRLPDDEVKTARRTLNSSHFQKKLTTALRKVFNREPPLRKLTAVLSR